MTKHKSICEFSKKLRVVCSEDIGTEISILNMIFTNNIPEGIAVGVEFGAATTGSVTGASISGAIALAIGIGLQNFTEEAVSIPLRREGLSRTKAFLCGQASGIVKPLLV